MLSVSIIIQQTYLLQEPSPLLVKASEESLYDGEESRDTLLDASFDHINATIEETPVVPVEKPTKRVN